MSTDVGPSESPEHPAEGTAAALIVFLTYTVEKGHVKAATANAMKVAAREVLLAAEGEGWEKVDVRNLDLDDVQRRFQTLRALKYKPESLHTYSQRFENAVRMYVEFLRDPRAWRPTVRTRTVGNRARRDAAAQSAAPQTTGSGPSPVTAEERAATGDAASTRMSLIPYPFPLRGGVLATLHLPPDLTRREAGRLTAFIQSLAIDGGTSQTGSE